MLTERKKTIVITTQIITAAVLAILPWTLLLLGMTLRFDVMWRCIEVIYACDVWWWLVALILAVFALVETICWKRRGLMAITILLLLIIPVVGLAWGALITLGKHPPA